MPASRTHRPQQQDRDSCGARAETTPPPTAAAPDTHACPVAIPTPTWQLLACIWPSRCARAANARLVLRAVPSCAAGHALLTKASSPHACARPQQVQQLLLGPGVDTDGSTDPGAGLYCVLSTGSARFTAAPTCASRVGEAFVLTPWELQHAERRAHHHHHHHPPAGAPASEPGPVLTVELFAPKRWGSDALVAAGELLLGPHLAALSQASSRGGVDVRVPLLSTKGAKGTSKASGTNEAGGGAGGGTAASSGEGCTVIVLQLAAHTAPPVPEQLLGGWRFACGVRRCAAGGGVTGGHRRPTTPLLRATALTDQPTRLPVCLQAPLAAGGARCRLASALMQRGCRRRAPCCTALQATSIRSPACSCCASHSTRRPACTTCTSTRTRRRQQRQR